MDSFVILFRQADPAPTADEKQRITAETIAWARLQNEAGHRLDPRILGGTGEITALLFLEARDLSEASTIAASHPAARYGAQVEVRSWGPPAR